MIRAERKTVREERDAFRRQTEREIDEKLRRMREGLIKARTDPKEIARLERAYEKRLREGSQ